MFILRGMAEMLVRCAREVRPLRGACLLSVLCCYGLLAQPRDLRGSLELINAPPQSTPVSAVSFSILNLDNRMGSGTLPDANGEFTLRQVTPGRYSLEIPVPGRIVGLELGSRRLDPDVFEIRLEDSGPLRIVVSLETAVLVIDAKGSLPDDAEVVAVVCPQDPWLTLRNSCGVSPVQNGKAMFSYKQPGKYRAFVVNLRFAGDVAKYGPRDPEFLRDRARLFEVVTGQENRIVAEYLDAETVQRAVQTAESTSKGPR